MFHLPSICKLLYSSPCPMFYRHRKTCAVHDYEGAGRVYSLTLCNPPPRSGGLRKCWNQALFEWACLAHRQHLRTTHAKYGGGGGAYSRHTHHHHHSFSLCSHSFIFLTNLSSCISFYFLLYYFAGRISFSFSPLKAVNFFFSVSFIWISFTLSISNAVTGTVLSFKITFFLISISFFVVFFLQMYFSL